MTNPDSPHEEGWKTAYEAWLHSAPGLPLAYDRSVIGASFKAGFLAAQPKRPSVEAIEDVLDNELSIRMATINGERVVMGIDGCPQAAQAIWNLIFQAETSDE